MVLYLDLDQFKAVNDSRGHLIGDKLLVQVSKRIKSALREADIAARLGGDEFAIILNNNCDADETAALAHRLVETVGKPYEFDEDIVSIGVSIGIAIAPINGTRPDQILRNADLALYRAKAEGRGTWRFFESQMDSDVRERRMLELELRQALKEGEFVLHYQPLVSAEDNKPSGFEALVRWNHPIRGIVPPAEFIPIAEQTGLIKQIGDWTIHEACHAAARWPEDLLVAVNLSAKHFQMSDITAVVREALAASKLPPHRLELEITESLLIERPDDVVEKLGELKALGVTIAMDDFGTGYSSLSHLLKFPFDKIKIDRSFVTASPEDVDRPRHPSLDRFARQDAEDHDRRRGRRDAGAGGFPARHRLRRAAGLLLRQAAQRDRSGALFPGPVRSADRPGRSPHDGPPAGQLTACGRLCVAMMLPSPRVSGGSLSVCGVGNAGRFARQGR